MAKRDNLIRWAVGLFALMFLAVPLYRFWRGGAPPTARQQDSGSDQAASRPTQGRPVSTIEMLHTAGSLEEAVALMNLLPIRFAEDSPRLGPDAQPFIEETAAAIRRVAGGRKVEIVVSAKDGKTAEAKAKSLQASLVSRGVEPAGLTARGKADPSAALDKITYRIAGDTSSSPAAKSRSISSAKRR